MALTPSYLQKCTDQIEKDFQDLVTEILIDMAERIRDAGSMTSTTEYLDNKLRMLSLQQQFINQALAKLLNTTESNIEKLMEESAYKSTRDTMNNLEAHGYDTSGLEFGEQIKKATNIAKGEVENLTRTTGNLATSKMTNLYDQAYLQVASGAYSYDQAVTNAVKKLAQEGLGEVTYPTGAKRSVEAAVRVAVRTSVAQNALKCEEDMLDEMDVNLVEVSSHLGARPSHAVWQGKIYWRKHPEGNYDNFYEATGYGTPTGLGGYNCRHQFYAYFGDDDEQAYHHIDETLNEKYYKMEQQQRAYERKMREWDRKEKVLNAGGQDTTEARRWKNYYRDKINELIKSSDGFLKRDYSAEKAYSLKATTGASKGDKVNKPQRKQLSMRKSYQEYEEYIQKNYSKFKGETGDTKEDWIKILEKYSFQGPYVITKTPKILESYGIHDDILMTQSNLAYVLSQHISEYEIDTLLKIKETIDNYDLLFEGKQEGTKDFKFYKLFKDEALNEYYGIEIAIDRPNSDRNEYIVHVNYIGSKHKRGIKQINKLKRKLSLIDEKNWIK